MHSTQRTAATAQERQSLAHFFSCSTVLATHGIATARMMDFTLPRQKGSALPLLANAQSDAVRSKQATAMGLSTHTSREGHKNLANAT